MGTLEVAGVLDEAVGDCGGGRMVVVEDCVETGGAFVVHYLLKRSLSASDAAVVFVAFAQPLAHYDRILRRMGCNLDAYRDRKRFQFFDVFSAADGLLDDIVLQLYGKIHGTVESFAGERPVVVIIDDISVMEIDANEALVLDFLKSCCSLSPQFGCSLVALIHGDVYSSMDQPSLLLQLEYMADVVVKVEPLATGLAADVHGQLTVSKKRNRAHDMQFRIKDSGVELFYPGTKGC
ncbi:hypothetical protein M569_04844 [Genlisea aurea]|uniref:Elongator complex protein 6 n=1 Tax=Genlisea aurea TaxID=192259 RepID=S8E2P4_9LAMI|nr:hypothetical protein M569_04844 [Genlisea aurea]